MLFILLFVMVSIAFPLSVEIAKRGADNILVRSANETKVLVAESIEIVFSYIGGKESVLLSAITGAFSKYLSSVNEKLRMVIAGVLGLFVLYIILKFAIWLLDIVFSGISWLFS